MSYPNFVCGGQKRIPVAYNILVIVHNSDSRWERCIYRASRPSQGTVNGGAVSKWPRCWRDVKHKQTNIIIAAVQEKTLSQRGSGTMLIFPLKHSINFPLFTYVNIDSRGYRTQNSLYKTWSWWNQISASYSWAFAGVCGRSEKEGFHGRVWPKTLKWVVVYSCVTLHINGLHSDRSALYLYTITGWGVMSCICSMKFLCGSTLIKMPLLQVSTVAIWPQIRFYNLWIIHY